MLLKSYVFMQKNVDGKRRQFAVLSAQTDDQSDDLIMQRYLVTKTDVIMPLTVIKPFEGGLK